ncbi:hypothetical protein SAMN04244572_00336 [Azotobacter beijerinckii]|uniref:Uncharacterized protein n=1 Tax=Azotobacter beijerinckii TaxID=170623 RepID=A0A1H6QNZ2_9GAMM|nr:hypothetical protein [Azotobacter beijerinckii]SEI45273.1 hypothetical protein SAMN04244572_00336 [Azotobacter beijerinckii]
MYHLINNNVQLLLNGINREDHIDPYVSIRESFENQKNNTPKFRSTYRQFYKLNAARLSEKFCELYFALLEEHRNDEYIQVESITNSLYELESNSKGTHAVHFSFASKLVHTINNDLPVYDSMVAAFYFFPNIKSNWNKAKKIEEYLTSYHFLINEYKRVIENNLLGQAIEQFRERFEVGIEYSDVKLIDTLIWRYTALLKSGAIRNGQMQYG